VEAWDLLRLSGAGHRAHEAVHAADRNHSLVGPDAHWGVGASEGAAFDGALHQGGNARPARGLELLPAVLAYKTLFANHFVPPSRARQLITAEYDGFARERHPKLLAYGATLEKLGYHVFGVPDLWIDPMENLFRPVNLDFGYCNVLPGLWHGRPAVYYLPWGIRALDSEGGAGASFESAPRQRPDEPLRWSSLLLRPAHPFFSPDFPEVQHTSGKNRIARDRIRVFQALDRSLRTIDVDPSSFRIDQPPQLCAVVEVLLHFGM